AIGRVSRPGPVTMAEVEDLVRRKVSAAMTKDSIMQRAHEVERIAIAVTPAERGADYVVAEPDHRQCALHLAAIEQADVIFARLDLHPDLADVAATRGERLVAQAEMQPAVLAIGEADSGFLFQIGRKVRPSPARLQRPFHLARPAEAFAPKPYPPQIFPSPAT